MLSICIPIYETDVRPLVHELHAQAKNLKVPWEIICLDDGSSEPIKLINKELIKLPEIKILELGTNRGRAVIRNKLCEEAQYPVLIFVDNDMVVESPDYLQKYLAEVRHPLVYGGTVYSRYPPAAPDLRFHWRYGKKKEEVSQINRQKNPWISFKTNNFLVQKKVLTQTPFNESFRYYGYEDLNWVFQLEKEGIKPRHIDNPLRHDGLERAEVLVAKIEQAIENLSQWSIGDDFRQVRIYRTYQRLLACGLGPALKLAGIKLSPALKRILATGRGSLWLLDLYKLLLLHSNLHKG